MSKKIYFNTISEKAASVMSQIADIIFSTTAESRELAKQINSLKSDLEKAEENSRQDAESVVTMGGDTPEVPEVSALKKQIKILETKKTECAAYRRNTLFDSKDTAGNEMQGLFTTLGVGKDLFTAYESAFTGGKFDAYNKSIKNILTDVLKMDLNERLTKQLSMDLFHAVGLQLGTASNVMQGKLTRTLNKNRFYQLFALAMVEKVAATCDKVNVPDEKNYDWKITYNKNLEVTGIKVSEKTTEAENDKNEKVA